MTNVTMIFIGQIKNHTNVNFFSFPFVLALMTTNMQPTLRRDFQRLSDKTLIQNRISKREIGIRVILHYAQ